MVVGSVIPPIVWLAEVVAFWVVVAHPHAATTKSAMSMRTSAVTSVDDFTAYAMSVGADKAY